MIRTTTTIRGSRVSKGQISTMLERVGSIVTDAVDRRTTGIQVEFEASYLSTQSVAKDRVTAKVTVTE